MFMLGAGQSVYGSRDLILSANETRNAAPMPLPEEAVTPSWTIGKGVKRRRVALGAITTVQIKAAGPIMNGFIQFTLPGGIEMKSSFGSQPFDAAGDENSMLFTQFHEPAFLTFRDAVRQAIDVRSRAAQTVPADPDVMVQLAKLGRLKEYGVLTQAEFEGKKAELLGRI